MVLQEGGDYREMISGLDAPPASTATDAGAEPKKDWVHKHPYVATTIGVGGLLILGTALVIHRTDVSPSNSSGAWGGAGGMFFNGVRSAVKNQTNTEVNQGPSAQDTVAFIPILNRGQDENPDASTAGDDSITALLSLLVRPNQASGTSGTDAPPGSYAFIPQGFVSAEASTKKRTPTQDSLHDYGNQVGTYIKGYEDTHYNTWQILKDHIEDRTNPQKITPVRNLGLDMEQLGNDLAIIEDIPKSAGTQHKAYANAYIAAGKNLVKVAGSVSDEEFVNAITAYNASVDELTRRFLALVALFGTNEVTFSSSEQGNIFMFTSNLSLIQ